VWCSSVWFRRNVLPLSSVLKSATRRTLILLNVCDTVLPPSPRTPNVAVETGGEGRRPQQLQPEASLPTQFNPLVLVSFCVSHIINTYQTNTKCIRR